jgi:hypothetical protein
MKNKIVSTLLVLAIMLVALNVGTAFAGAYDTAFTTSITYQNVGSSATTQLEVWFYESPDDTSPTIIPRDNLAPGAGTSLFIGSLSQISPGFQGTAIMVSDQPLLATLVQLPQNSTTVKNRPLSNGFSSGTEDSLISTVIKNAFAGSQNTIFSVQNVGPSATDVTIKFYNTSATLVHTITDTLQPGAGRFIDVHTVSALGSTFNGSVVVESNGGSIISSAMELQVDGVGARAFEGIGSGGMEFYMPSALCDRGPNKQTTNFAIQNTNLTTATDVTITYFDKDGNNTGSETKNIGPGAKSSFRACDVNATDFIGSAKITSASQPVIAMGKAAGGGLFTAYVGFKSASNRVALPYVRWSTSPNFYSGSQQRVNIAIQNIGSSTIPANSVVIKYIDRNGTVVGTHTIDTSIDVGSKVNSNASFAGLSEFGYYYPGAGGGVIIEGPSGSQLAAIARVATYVPASGQTVGEDYNGMDIP